MGVFNTLANVKGNQTLIECLFLGYLDIVLCQSKKAKWGQGNEANSLAAM